MDAIPRVVWDKMTSEERNALPVEVRQASRLAIREYNLRRFAKNQEKRDQLWMAAEYEAWAEYREREKAAKLARALAKLRAKKVPA